MLDISEKIQNILDRFDGSMSIRLTDVVGNVYYEKDPERIMKIASVGKLFILGALLEKCEKEAEKFSLSHRVTVKNGDKVEGSGVLQYLDEGDYSIKDLATLMVIVSDNTATNKVLAYLGGAKVVKDHLASCGITESGVNRRIAMTEEDLKIGCFAQANVADLTRYLVLVEKGEILSEESLTVFNDILEKQQYKDMFLRRIAEQPDIRCGSKTGFDEDQRADAGWIFTEDKTYVYALIAGGGSDTGYTADNEAAVCMAEIGEILYEGVIKKNL